ASPASITSLASIRGSSNWSVNQPKNRRYSSRPRYTSSESGSPPVGMYSNSGARSASKPSRSPRLKASNAARIFSTFSSDIVHAVSRLDPGKTYASTVYDASADGQRPHRGQRPRGGQGILRRTRFGAGRRGAGRGALGGPRGRAQ